MSFSVLGKRVDDLSRSCCFLRRSLTSSSSSELNAAFFVIICAISSTALFVFFLVGVVAVDIDVVVAVFTSFDFFSSIHMCAMFS